MILDSSELTEGFSLDVHTCIVGSGPAGLSLAFSLEEAGLSVCILEAGGLEPESASQELCRVTQSGQPCFDPSLRRTFALGGTTWMWSGWCRPFDKIDFQERPWVPHSGWPVSYSSVASYYDRAGQFLGLSDTRFDPHEVETSMGIRPWNIPDQSLETRYFRVLRPATRLGPVYLHRLKKSQKITVITHAVANDLTLDESHKKVHAVNFRASNTRPLKVQVRNAVTALGAIDNPRFLLNVERKHRTRGLKFSSALGRYFMLRPHARAGRSDLSVSSPVAMERYNHEADEVVARIFLSAYGQERYKMMRYNMSFLQGAGFQNHALMLLGLGCLPSGDRRRFIKQMGFLCAGAAFAGCSTVREVAGRWMHLQHTTEQAPNPESRVGISHEVDAFGELRANVEWQQSPLDYRTLYEGAEKVERKLNRWNRIHIHLEGFGKTSQDQPPDHQQGSPGHYMGTTRMGTQRTTSVVDANCKVHEVDNLFVAGCSVFPTSGNGTPTLTMVALAMKLADHLKLRV